MSGISPPMRILLVVTLLLTGLSYGVRSWRESAALPPVIEGAVPARPATDIGTPAQDETSAQVLRSPELLRPIWPTASIDAMASRQQPAAATVENTDGAAPAALSSPDLPGPSFRLVGSYAEGKKRRVFFAQGDALIAVRVGQTLPDGFALKAVHKDKVTVIRTQDGHLFDMTLEAP